MIRIVHILNQFFAGIGGEDKADIPVTVVEGCAGAARGLQTQLADRAQITATIYFGDNYFHEHKESALAAIAAALEKQPADVVVAGPAFNAGRYGLACVEICQTVSERLGLRCVTGMEPENPGVSVYRDYHNDKIFLLPTAETAAGMARALTALAPFACRLANGEEIGPAAAEGYLPRGIRRLVQVDRTGADRAIDMLLAKLAGQPFTTEIPMEVWDKVEPAAPLADASSANLAVICTGGVVPWGNPDGFKTYRNTFWRKYNFAELKALEPGKWEAVHGGYNVAFMNQNPHYGMPLDALRALEADGKIGRGKLYPAYYVIPGNQGSPAVMRRVGQEISADLKKDGVEGVLLVAT
ncbi:MAG TPA: glycine/betaine/sarcosine/D-proline family reductase selenoprotein B [Candidatus Binatus sp.]|nr:glycine/betaine/sarcosine/D-proline family reductase selenoprotein B [Candidatus Binatus sp.]